MAVKNVAGRNDSHGANILNFAFFYLQRRLRSVAINQGVRSKSRLATFMRLGLLPELTAKQDRTVESRT